MSRPLRIIVLIGLPIFALFLGLGLGASIERERFESAWGNLAQQYSGASGSGKIVTGDPAQEVQIGLLWEVWRQLSAHYIEPSALTIDKLTFGAVRGLVAAVGDPYTVFMTPDENQEFQAELSGTLEGIGAELTQKDDAIVVVAPIKNSPAQKAGLMPHDILWKVNGEDITGMSLNEVVSKVRGKEGTQVKLTVIRGEAPIEMAITRASIHVPNVESEIMQTASGSIGYISLNMFGNESMAEFRAALDSFKNSDIKGIIIDLRFNGGGLLDGAVELVSMFQKEGKVVSVEQRNAPTDVYEVSGRTIYPDIPLVVIINQGSASASEIVAGALQDHKRATIVGMQSFGKGTVQEVLDLPGGSSLRVTVAKWMTPDGHDLGKKGVTPDIVVDRTPEDFTADRDPQLEKAKEILLK